MATFLSCGANGIMLYKILPANANNAKLASYLLVRGASSLMFEKPSYLLSPIIFVSFSFFME